MGLTLTSLSFNMFNLNLLIKGPTTCIAICVTHIYIYLHCPGPYPCVTGKKLFCSSRSVHIFAIVMCLNNSYSNFFVFFSRWFIHFYIVSVICNSFLLLNLISVVFYNGQMPGWYLDALRFLTNYPLQNPKGETLGFKLP